MTDSTQSEGTGGPPKFSYTILYVSDVEKATAFYSKAFGFGIRRLDRSRRWGELETGHTTLAFTPLEQHEADITGGVEAPSLKEPRPNVEPCFSFPDVDAAFQVPEFLLHWKQGLFMSTEEMRAVTAGAVPVTPPEEKEWGQKVGYVRDLYGNIVRLGSDIEP